MRLPPLFVAFALAAVCAAQSQQVRDRTLAEAIDRVMKTGLFWGFDEKALSRGGDAGAVVTTRILADRELTDAEVGTLSGTTESCFRRLTWVWQAADREPRTALLLLRYLDYQARSPELKTWIAQAKKEILERYAASPADPMAAAGRGASDIALEGAIDRVMKDGHLAGRDPEPLRGAGDAGAVVLTRLLADRTLTDEEIATAVVALDECFYDPRRVDAPSDRHPSTTLFLLRYFDFQARSADLRKAIAGTRKVIVERCAAFAE